MTTSTPTVLDDFLAAAAQDRAPQARERDVAIVAELIDYLDHLDPEQVGRCLGTDAASLFACERDLGGGEGSFFRVFGVDELVCCVTGFIEPERGAGVTEAARVALVGRLLRWIARVGLVQRDLMCALFDAQRDVDRVRRTGRSRP